MAGDRERGENIDSVLLEIYSVNDISMNVDRYVHICSRWWIQRMYIVKICMKMVLITQCWRTDDGDYGDWIWLYITLIVRLSWRTVKDSTVCDIAENKLKVNIEYKILLPDIYNLQTVRNLGFAFYWFIYTSLARTNILVKILSTDRYFGFLSGFGLQLSFSLVTWYSCQNVSPHKSDSQQISWFNRYIIVWPFYFSAW